MNGSMLSKIRSRLSFLEKTPLHPKWLYDPAIKKRNFLRELNGGRVLDIGCNDRWASRFVSGRVEYVGLDYPETGSVLYQSTPDVYGTAASLPFPDASFDNVLLFDVLEHLRAPDLAIDEIYRVLRPGGIVHISVPFLYPLHDEPYDYQRPTRYGLVRDLDSAGFDVQEISEQTTAIECAALLSNLALSGSFVRAIEKRHPSVILMPLLLPLIPLRNIISWGLARMLLNWNAMAVVYWVSARRR